jgi:hypothetical protein
MYTHSIARPNGPGTETEYHMHQLRSFALNDTTETFLAGATTLKNALDITREYRDDAIASANETARRKAQEQRDTLANGIEEEQQEQREADEDEDGDDADDDDED